MRSSDLLIKEHLTNTQYVNWMCLACLLFCSIKICNNTVRASIYPNSINGPISSFSLEDGALFGPYFTTTSLINIFRKSMLEILTWYKTRSIWFTFYYSIYFCCVKIFLFEWWKSFNATFNNQTFDLRFHLREIVLPYTKMFKEWLLNPLSH